MVPLFLQQSLRFLVMPLSMSLRSILSDIFIILLTISLIISVNNVFILINFLSILFIISYELLGINCVEVTLLIVIMYYSAFLCLFLMNGFMFMSSFYSLFDVYFYCVFSINSYFNNLFVCFPCFWSIFLLEIAWNRFGNLIFDNDLLIFLSLILILIFLILNRKLPYQSCYSSLNCIEFFLLSQLIFIIFYIGMYYIWMINIYILL